MLIVDSTWNGRCYKKMRCLVIVPKTGGLGLRGLTYVIADGINTLLCCSHDLTNEADWP